MHETVGKSKLAQEVEGQGGGSVGWGGERRSGEGQEGG